MEERIIKETKKAIEVWKQLKIGKVEFHFSCGGDSMNDTEFYFYDENENDVTNKELDFLESYFDEMIYKRVDFYVNSDGHYQGEAGIVEIKLEDEDDDFSYYKDAESEWREMVSSNLFYVLDEEQTKFVQNKVLNINGDCDGIVINFKNDCLISDKEEKIITKLETNIQEYLRDFEPDDICDGIDGEKSEWYRFTTNNDDSDLVIENDNKLKIIIDNEFIVFRQSD